MKRRYYNIHHETKPFSSVRTNIIELKKQLDNIKTIIDLGCGKLSSLRFLDKDIYLYGIDISKHNIEIAKKNKIHNEYIVDNIMDINKHFPINSVEACVVIDVIEHLTHEDGLIFLNKIEKIAKKKVIIFTPNGFLPQKSKEKNDFQEHLSGWEINEMQGLGYKVYGMDGLKFLRGEHQRLKYKPAYFWAVISWISEKIWCKNHPISAAALLCIKKF